MVAFSGIHRPVHLECHAARHISDLWVETRSIDETVRSLQYGRG